MIHDIQRRVNILEVLIDKIVKRLESLEKALGTSYANTGLQQKQETTVSPESGDSCATDID